SGADNGASGTVASTGGGASQTVGFSTSSGLADFWGIAAVEVLPPAAAGSAEILVGLKPVGGAYATGGTGGAARVSGAAAGRGARNGASGTVASAGGGASQPVGFSTSSGLADFWGIAAVEVLPPAAAGSAEILVGLKPVGGAYALGGTGAAAGVTGAAAGAGA